MHRQLLTRSFGAEAPLRWLWGVSVQQDPMAWYLFVSAFVCTTVTDEYNGGASPIVTLAGGGTVRDETIRRLRRLVRTYTRPPPEMACATPEELLRE
jgi:hypothetical protein